MADYPSVPQQVGSERQATFNTTLDQAESGRPRLRTFYSKVWGVWKIVHRCTPTEKNTILSHYADHKLVSFNFVFAGDGLTYVVEYGDIPQIQLSDDNFLWDVETHLVEV